MAVTSNSSSASKSAKSPLLIATRPSPGTTPRATHRLASEGKDAVRAPRPGRSHALKGSDVPAQLRRLEHAFDAQLEAGHPERDLVLARPREALAVGAAHDRAEAVVDLAFVPP